MDEKKNYYQLIPKKELKCVWMTAGLITYKLCKYDLQCEKCPLDWELRNVSASPSSDRAASQAPAPPERKERSERDLLSEDLCRQSIHGSLFYHPGHTWVKVEKADEVRIGLDCFLGKIIGKVKVIVLPLSGRRCVQGESLCSLILEKGILDLVFPVSGLILSVNERLKDEPELITEDPLGEGFLLTLKPRNLQRDQRHLFFGEAAVEWYQRELERFKGAVVPELTHSAVHPRSGPTLSPGEGLTPGRRGVGVTMQDGQIRLGEIKRSTDPERYIQLVSTFLRKGERDFLSAREKRNVTIT